MASQPVSVGEYLSSFTGLGKVLAGTIVGGFLLQLVAPSCRTYLALIAGRTLPFVSNVVTSGFLEESLISAIAYAIAVLFLLRTVDPIYGPREVLRFLLVTVAATGVSTFLLVFLLYLSSQDQAMSGTLLYTEICGFHGAFAALLVAAKQGIPDAEVSLFGGLLKFRAKHLPSLYVLVMVGMGVVAGQSLKLIPFVLFGTYYGWLYLRFWQYKGEGMRGDPSDDFRFSTFFPGPVQPVVDRVAGPCAVLFRLGGGSQQAQHGRGKVMGGATEPAAPGSSDAARRRERGAKALEERLGLKASTEGSKPADADIEAPAAAAAQG